MDQRRFRFLLLFGVDCKEIIEFAGKFWNSRLSFLRAIFRSSITSLLKENMKFCECFDLVLKIVGFFATRR